ncbi:MAG: rhodanese-like domain-containing protein [Nostocales cyanobacterium ELA583]
MQKLILILSKNPQLLLIDVRTPAEYEYTHIPGAMLVTLTDIQAGSGSKKIKSLIPRHQLVTYCSVGVRSNKALELLRWNS